MSQNRFTNKMKAVDQNQDFLPWAERGAHHPGSLKQDWGKKKINQKISFWESAMPWLLSSGLSPFIWAWEQPRRCHTGQCNVLGSFATPRLCSVATPLCCAGADGLNFSQISPLASLAWRQLAAARSGYEAEAPKPLRSSSPLTEASTRLFLRDLLPILSLWGLIIY